MKLDNRRCIPTSSNCGYFRPFRKCKTFLCIRAASRISSHSHGKGIKKIHCNSTPEGHVEFERMPFGFKTAPATFQRMMDNALRGLNGKICMVYLDDIVVFDSKVEEHNQNLVTLFERQRQTGLKLQFDKCQYLKPKLEYLGHVITKDAIKLNSAKLQAVAEFRIPNNVTEVKSFLGLLGYYRKFIKNYSTIAKPPCEARLF